MATTPGDQAKYRRLRALGMSHKEAVAHSATTPSPDLGGGGGGGDKLLARLVRNPATATHHTNTGVAGPANTDLTYNQGSTAVLALAFTPQTDLVRVRIEAVTWHSAAAETFWYMIDQLNTGAQVPGTMVHIYSNRTSAERSSATILVPVVAGTNYDWRLGYRQTAAVSHYLLAGSQYGPAVLEAYDVGTT